MLFRSALFVFCFRPHADCVGLDEKGPSSEAIRAVSLETSMHPVG